MSKPRSSRKTRAAAPLDKTAEVVAQNDPRDGMLVAAEAVIAKQGLPRASLEEIARRANVSVDVLQGYFSGKPAIVRALGDRFSREVIAAVTQATRSGIWAKTPAHEFIELAVRSIVDVIFQREGLVRALLAHGTLDPAVSAGLVKIGAALTARAHAVLGECEGHPKIAKRKLGFALSTAAAIGHQAILLSRDWSGEYVPREEVVNEAVRVVCSYLGLRGDR